MAEIVGMIGLGRMGMPAAKALIKAGYHVVAHDCRAEAMEEILSAGGEPASDYETVARKAHTVILFVLNDQQVIEVVTGSRGLLAGTGGGSVVVCMATIRKDNLLWVAEQCRKQNVAFVDCPCTGGPARAESGTLTLIAAAEDDLLDRCRPILEKLGSIVHVGQAPGMGQAVKHCNQLLISTLHAATMEVILMAKKSGLDANQVCEVVGSGVGGSGCAALLAGAGYDVTLLEGQSFAGGRCASQEKEGFRYDFGVHMFSRGNKGPLGEINRRTGGDLRWVTHDWPCHIMGRMEFDFPLDINSLLRQFYLARKLGVKPRNYLGAFRLLLNLMGGKAVEENDGVILQDYVSRFTDDEVIHLFVNCVSQLYFAQSYRQSSAGEFLWSFSRMFKGASFGYPLGAGGGIPGSYIRSTEHMGGKALFEEEATRIIVEGGRAVGVETARGTYPADIVVSNAGMRNTVRVESSSKVSSV